VASVKLPPQNCFTFGRGGLGNELGEGEEVVPVVLFLLMYRSSQEVDNKWQDGSTSHSVLLKEGHEGVVKVAITFWGGIVRIGDSDCTSWGKGD
jgi:hypothetical protein